MKRLILKLFRLSLNIVYVFFKLFKTRHKVVFISRQSNNISDDFRMLGEELQNQHGFQVVYLCKTLDGGVDSTILTKLAYGFHMFSQMYHLSTSSLCVLDSYSPVVSILKHKKSLKIVQIWHSIGKLKKFGWQIIGSDEGSSVTVAKLMKMHKNYDVIYCAGEGYKEVLMEGFNADASKFRIFTLPRVDLLTDKDYIASTKAKIYDKYPQLKEKETVIYAPTFRKNEDGFNEGFQKLVECFNFEKYNLVVKLHPLSDVEVTDSRVIFDKDFSTFRMLCCADKFISDYSCMIYEAGIMGIPVYFYSYDMDKYLDKRGLAIDYDILPGFKESDAQRLIDSLELQYDYDYLNSFIKGMITNVENCTEKMAKDIASLADA